MAFAELAITSNFTFLTGGSHPQEYALRAIELGLPAFAIADRNSVAGLVRAHQELKEAARDGAAVPRLVPAARLCLADGLEVTALPRNRAGWARLCRLLTLGARRTEKGKCLLHAADLVELDDLHLLLHPPPGRGLRAWLPGARGFARRTATPTSSPARATTARTRARIARAARLAAELGLPLVASAEPVMHHGARRRLVDVLTCIREGLRIDASAAPRSPTPSAGCAPRPTCCASSPATRPPSTAPARSPRTAASASTSSATSTRRRSGTARIRRPASPA